MASMDRALRTRSFLFLLFAVAGMTLYVFGPYLLTLLIAAAFAVIFHPLYRWLRQRIRLKWLSSLLTVIIAGVIVLVPLTWIITQIAISASALYSEFASGSVSLAFLEVPERYVRETFPQLDFNAESVLAQIFGWIGGNAGSLLSGTVNTAIRFAVGCFAFYIFVRDGEHFVSASIRFSPLPPKDTSAILSRMHATILSIIRGNLLVCVAQGIVTSVVMVIFGIPNPVLWGALTVIVAIAPAIGPSAVILPAALYLFSLGSTVPAVVFTGISMAGVWVMSNIVGPVLVSQGVKVHELWIIISVIGGIVTLGPLGFIVGPLCVSVLSTLVDMAPHVLRERRIAAK